MADREKGGNYPVDGVRLNTSRNALEYILRSLPDCKHVYLPLYTCEAVVQPFKRLPNLRYSFYHINEKFEIEDEIQLQEGDYLIANNYFGIKDAYIAELANKMRSIYASIKGVDVATIPEPEIVDGEAYYGKGYEDSLRRLPSVSKAENLVGFKAATPLDVVLEESLRWFVDHYQVVTE